MYSTTRQPLNEQEVVNSLAAHFACLTDNRKPRGLRYQLTPLLVLIVLAKLCGLSGAPQADFANALIQLGLPDGLRTLDLSPIA